MTALNERRTDVSGFESLQFAFESVQVDTSQCFSQYNFSKLISLRCSQLDTFLLLLHVVLQRVADRAPPSCAFLGVPKVQMLYFFPCHLASAPRNVTLGLSLILFFPIEFSGYCYCQVLQFLSSYDMSNKFFIAFFLSRVILEKDAAFTVGRQKNK